MSIRRTAFTLLCLLASSALAEDHTCTRLVDLLPTRTFGAGLHSVELNPPASARAQWFISVAGEDPAFVELDGRIVAAPSSLAGAQDRATIQVQLRSRSCLRVLVPGRRHSVSVRVLGLVPSADLPPGVGTRVGEVEVFDQHLPAGLPARKTRLTVPAPGADGLLFLSVEPFGWTPLILSRVLWNDEGVLGTIPFHSHCAPIVHPVLSRLTNSLEAQVLGVPGSSVRLRLRGWVTDTNAPTGSWDSPAEGADAGAGTTFRLTWSDAGTGVDPARTRITLNGQDVTASFSLGVNGATATFEGLPPGAFVAGVNTIRAIFEDRACNGRVAERHFTTGGGSPDLTPPVVQQPANLLVEQAGPAGSVVTYPLPLATDDRDPAPVVTCTPASGSLFPAGVTVVSCVAQDAAGNVSQPVTFTVTVRDTTPPQLAQPPDLTVEQDGPAGSVVGYPLPVATDAVDPAPVVVGTPPPGALFPAGFTTVTCTATDAAGNSSAPVTFRVRVRDTRPPVVGELPNLVVEQQSAGGTVVTFAAPPATDTVDPQVDVICVPASGSLFPPGQTVVQCVGRDDAGNMATTIFTVLVLDRTPPTVGIASPGSGAVAFPYSRLQVTYADAVATVDSTFQVLAQGRDVTALLTRGPGTAEAELSALGLEPGAVSVVASVRDPSGNLGSATITFQYTVPTPAVALQIEIPPAPTAPLLQGQSYDLTLRAVTGAGDVASTFTGLVLLQTTDPGSSLNGVLVDFSEVHAGVRTLPGVVEFPSEGSHTVTATVLQGAPIQGSLSVQVARTERGRVLVVIPNGIYTPGQTVLARVFVDVGPADLDAETWQDVLGAYDVRLLFDHRQVEVLRVDAGPTTLGAPLFALPGSLRLMDLNDLGSLRAPGGPDPNLSGLVEVAKIDLRVRDTAPTGPLALAVVGDALTTAEPAQPDFQLSRLGPLGPRLGEVEGQASVFSLWPSAGLIVIGVLPRDGEGLVAGPQGPVDPRVVLSAAVDPTTLGNVTLTRAGVSVPGVAMLGDGANEVRFVPSAPLAPGEYQLEVGSGLAALGGGPLGLPQRSTFTVGPVPAPLASDLDHDGETAVLDLQVRRDVLLGRTPGSIPDFPPLFLRGAPGTVQPPHVGASEVELEVVDPQGAPVSLSTETLPEEAQLERTGADTFRLTVAGTASVGTISLTARNAADETSQAVLRVVPQRRNAAPGLVLVEADWYGQPAGVPITVREGEWLRLRVEATDADFLDPVSPDHVTFLASDFPNVEPPQVSGPFGEVAVYTFNPDFDQSGEHTIELRVRDDAGAEGVLSVQVVVLNKNRPPVFTSAFPSEPVDLEDNQAQLVFSFTAEDPDGDPVTVVPAEEFTLAGFTVTQESMPGGLTIRATPGASQAGGSFGFAAIATDGQDLTYAVSRSYTFPPPPPPPPPLQNPLTLAVDTSDSSQGFPRNVVPLAGGAQGWIQLFGLAPSDVTGEGVTYRILREGAVLPATIQYDATDRIFQFFLDTPLPLDQPVEVILEVVDNQGRLHQTRLILVGDGGLNTQNPPELLSVSDPALRQLHVRLRVHDAQRVHSFVLDGVPGATVRVGLQGPPDPLGTVDYDLVIGRTREAGTLLLSVRYRTDFPEDPLNPPFLLPASPIEIELLEAPPNFPVSALVRYRPDGELQELPPISALTEAQTLPILPEDVDPLEVALGPTNPYAMFLVAPRNPSPFPEPQREGGLSVTTPFGTSFGAAVPLSGARPGPLHFNDQDDVATDYRTSLPILLAFRHQSAGTVSPVQVYSDRIVVSVGLPNIELESYPAAGPLDEERTQTEFFVAAQVTNGNPHYVQPFVPGLVVRTPPNYPVLFAVSEPLDGAGVWCAESIEAFDPWMGQGEVRVESPPDSGIYLDLGDAGAAPHPAELPYQVFDYVETTPGFVQAANRVRLYSPAGAPLFEAKFDLLIAGGAIAAKTSPGFELFVDYTCDGVRLGDPAQASYLQADLPLDDMEGPATARAGASVLLATGEETLERTDMVIPGRAGLDFKVVRHYRSHVHHEGQIGYGWNLNWFERLGFVKGGKTVGGETYPDAVWRQTGTTRVAVWTKDPNSSRYMAPNGHFGTLIFEPERHRWVMRTPDGMKHHYSSFHGGLTEMEDRFGNMIQIFWDSHQRISHVLDVYSRRIDFVYATQTSGGYDGHAHDRLIRIVDFAGRSIEYAYDADGDLIVARTPVVDGPSPHRREEVYTYSRGFGGSDPTRPEYQDNKLNHNLLSVKSPAEVAYNGPPSLQLVYDENDRVVLEHIGGQGLEGETSGGTRSFLYEEESDPFYGSDMRVTVNEPNNRVRHVHYIRKDLRVEVGLVRLSMGIREGDFTRFETISGYNKDGLLVLRKHPEGNLEKFTYGTGARGAQRNLIEHVREAGPRGADQTVLTTRYTYEPLYNQIASITDSRGIAPGFRAPPGSAFRPVSPSRYTTSFIYDYQEDDQLVPDAARFGIEVRGLIDLNLGDQNGDGITLQKVGNVVRTIHPTVTLEPDSVMTRTTGSALQAVSSLSRWNDGGQLVAQIDPLGNVTEYRYYAGSNPNGDGQTVPTRTFRPGGYLAAKIVDSDLFSPTRAADPPPQSLTTRFGYDAVGNMTAVYNPRGVRTEIQYNAVNQVVKVTRGADASAVNEASLRFVTTQTYDDNGRVTEIVSGLSEGSIASSPVTRTLKYDILGDVRENTVSWSGGSVTTRYEYDGNRNKTVETSPEGNKTVTTYDERDLPHLITHGAESPDAATTRMDYDRNGNMIRLIDAEDTDGSDGPEVTVFSYDGHDRLRATTDALGNSTILALDPVGNVVGRKVMGHPPGAPQGAPVRLAESFSDFDELKRLYQTREQLFVSGTGQEQTVRTRRELDAASRQVYVVDAFTQGDAEQVTTTLYDGANRPIETRDAAGNRTTVSYDDNGNPVQVTSHEVAAGGLVPERAFVQRARFDQLDRLVLAIDPAGHARTRTYDPRDNLILETDPVGPLMTDPVFGTINGAGNTRHYTYDGLDRLLAEDTTLRVGGEGPGGVVGPAGLPGGGASTIDGSNPANSDGHILVQYRYDRNSRLVAVIDDKLRETRFAYDALDRQVSQTLADGSTYRTEYDRDGNVRRTTDPNGSVIVRTYDAINRVLEATVQQGAGVLGTNSQSFTYDGLSRVVSATDRSQGLDQACEWTYDSLGRVLSETQNGEVVQSQWAGDGRRTRLIYPGGRTLGFAHDTLDRVTAIVDGSTNVCRDDWVGPGMRLLARQYGNGTSLQFHQAGAQVGYDEINRITDLVWRTSGGATEIVNRHYTYNRASMRTSEQRREDANLTDRFTFDSAYRITASSYDQAGAPRQVSYRLDGVGNRVELSGDVAAVYSSNEVNEYVDIDGAPRTHDRNGNLVEAQGVVYSYDAFDRLRFVSRRVGASLAPIAAYSYLADGRRCRAQEWDTTTGALKRDVRFVYDGVQEIEEQTATGQTQATFVWGSEFVDSLLQFQRTSLHPEGAGSFYVHQDARYNVVAVTDTGGVVRERRKFDDYGQQTLTSFTPTGNPVGLGYGFQGRRFDAETGLCYFRARYYDPLTGRFLSRDPKWDPGNAGNQYTFEGNNPASMVDPSGRILFLAVPAWLAFTALTASGAAIYAARDYYVQSVTSAGFTAGEFDWQSTAKAAAWGAVEGFSAALGGGGGGSVIGFLTKYVKDEVISQAIEFGIGLAIEKGMAAYYGDQGGGGGGEEGGDDEDLGNCFLAGTPVVAGVENSDGTITRVAKPVEEVKPDDWVKAKDPRTGEVGWKRVKRTFENVTTEVWSVTVGPAECLPLVRQTGRTERHRVGDAGGGEEDGEPPPGSHVVRCTAGHPWALREPDGRIRWEFASRLRVGDRLDPEDGGSQLVVLAIEVRQEVARTYNFEVDGWHTYYVAGPDRQPGVLVHNTSWAARAAAASGRAARLRRAAGAVKTANTRRLDDIAFARQRAAELRTQLGDQSFLVGAVGVARERGVRRIILSSNETGIPTALRNAARPGEIIAPGLRGRHAEQSVERLARARGWHLGTEGATIAHCPGCWSRMDARGIWTASERAAISNRWINQGRIQRE